MSDIPHLRSTELVPPWGSDCWQDRDEARLTCRAVQVVSHDVKTFLFAAEGPQVFRFDPGQFITLELEIGGVRLSRCYTIASPPTRPHLIALTVKRVPGGPVSTWLHDHLVPGDTVLALAPLGQFTLTPPLAPKYLFLAAGSGITPLMSMIRTLADLGSDADVTFVQAARTPADLLFRDELAAISAAAPSVRVVHLCESDHPTQRWTGLRGRLTDDVLQVIAPDLHERLTYACGPDEFMAATRRVLAARGYDMAGYREESFRFESLPAEEQTLARPPQRSVDGGASVDGVGAADRATFTVEFVRSGRTVECPADWYVLDAALSSGLRLPAKCHRGTCGTCKAVLIEGSVDMEHHGGIRPREMALGRFLPCCSRPISDLRIDA